MKSNIYTFLFFIIFLNTQKVKSQDEGGAKKQYIPNITVASPQAASISKVGEIPVDLSTGKMNYTIPIFEIKEGSFTMPINLSYNYSGLLLDETPGYAGVGWAFNIGGSILHSINGLDDPGNNSSKLAVYNYINKLPPYDDYSSPAGLSTITHYLENVSNGLFDTEPDKYSVNAGNLNCSFYLDKDNNPIFLKNENYKVSGYNHSGFTITDDQGINYIFNQPLVASKSSVENSYDYISSFLLTEINFPTTTNKIIFEYDTNTGYSDTSVTQTLTQNSTQYGIVQSFEINKNISTTEVSTNKLKKIITNNYTIELQYSNNPTESAIAVVSNLSVKDKFGKAVKSYDFAYSGWTGRRINLMNVKYNGAITNEMEYDMTLPYPVIEVEKDYAKKDLWGYYNKNGIPATVGGLVTPYDNPKLRPDFSSTKIGALKKITYQTKGYSIIDYEPNNVNISSGNYNFPYNSDGIITTNAHANTMAINNENVDEDTFTVTKVPAKVKINYNFTNHTQIAPTDYRMGNEVSISIGREAIFSKKQNWLWELRWDPTDLIITKQEEITIITPGTYTVKAFSVLGASAGITVTVTENPQSFNQTVGGIRVSTVQNCDFDGKCITTVYNYTQDDKSTGVMLQKPEFYSGFHIQDNQLCSPSIYVRRDFYNYTSIYPLSNFRGSPVLYKKVEKTDFARNQNNQLVSNGKTIFSYNGDEVSNSIRDLESYYTIGQLRTREVKNEDGTTVAKEFNNYVISVIPNTTKFLYFLSSKIVREKRAQLSGGGTSSSGCGLQYPRPLLDFQVPAFKYQSKNYILQRQESSNYFHGNSINQMTVYDYNADTGFLKSKITSSSQNEKLETKFYYPTDSEMASEPFRNELMAQNRIGTPLVTQNYNGEKISEQKTEYAQDALTSNLLMPKYVYANKGTAAINKSTDKKITYDKYDEKGNVLQYTLEGGKPFSIIWGYDKTYPIAKLENVFYDQVASYVPILQNLSNADDDNCMSDDCTEQILRNALNVNSIENAFITTYTYNPLVGVTSITDPKRVSSYYEYDSFGRLKFIKDKYLNVLQKYCYNYKGQLVNCSDNTSTSEYLYKSPAQSGPFTKNNCAAGGTGQSVSYSQPSGAYVSTISQADANSNGLAKFNTDGQAYANNTTSVKCTFWNTAQSRLIERNNCPAGGSPASVWYTVPAGRYYSTDSQAAADAQAQTEITNNGQAFANNDINAKCTYWNTAQSRLIQRNNCPAGGTPASVWYTVPAGRYSSDSQAAADAQAQTEINNNGKAFANNDVNAKCTFWNTAQSRLIERDNCAPGGNPESVWYVVPAGIYYSTDSQAAADAQAQSEITNNGQAFANANAKCTFYSVARSGSFTKDNCADGAIGSSVPFTQAAGAAYSNNSQYEADTAGSYKYYKDGQANANSSPSATCVFYNVVKTITANKNNCGTGTYGSAVTYTVPAGTYSSAESQVKADLLAQNDLTSNSRTYINANGTCTSETYDVFVADAEESQKKFWVTVTSSSSNHPERIVHATFNYSYIIGMKIYNGNWSSSLVLPAGVTNKTFILTLSFLGFPELKSFTIN